jgi:regulator of Ty1 transposition protein 109
MAQTIPVSLLEHLQDALASSPRLRTPLVRRVELHVLRSRSHRSHALFPWATDATTSKVYAHETLVAAAEDGVPIYGLEAAIYTVPASKVALVYVSKVDITGLLSPKDHPSPAATLTTAFIAHALAHPPHGCTDVRIHVFARAQDQYLFPGSIGNPHKRRLTDKELCRWWKRILTDASPSTESKRFYLLPGYSYLESVPYMPSSSVDSPAWTYGHPYAALRPIMTGASAPPTLNDLIPAFSDDPKARFLASLTSTPIPPTGEEGDYDDAHARALGSVTATADLQAALALERRRLVAVEGGPDEYWERMGCRQECMDGHLAAFFVVALEHPTSDEVAAVEPPTIVRLERTSYIHLWSRFHNVEYGDRQQATQAYATWRTDVEAACASDGVELEGLRGEAVVPMGAAESVKRPVEETKPSVMTLQPRKKVKKWCASDERLREAALTLPLQTCSTQSYCSQPPPAALFRPGPQAEQAHARAKFTTGSRT